MKPNPDICHLFILHKHETLFANVEKIKIWKSQQKKILVVFIDVIKILRMSSCNAEKQVKKLDAPAKISKL